MKGTFWSKWWVLGLLGLLALTAVAARPWDPAEETPQPGPGAAWLCQHYLQDKRQAEALGVSVEKLREARLEASLARMKAALDAGRITQEQYDRAVAWARVRFEYLHPEQLAARVLGMSVDELHQACEAGKTLRDLLDEKGLDPRDFRQAMEDAAVQQVLQALEDGKLTTEMLARAALRGHFRQPHPRGKGPKPGQGARP